MFTDTDTGISYYKLQQRVALVLFNQLRGDYNLAYILESIENPRADSPDSVMPDYEFDVADAE